MERRRFLTMGLVGLGAMAVADNSWALKYYPKKSKNKWAILYGTWCGSSRDAGVWISEGMGGIADVFDVRENPDLKGFDYVVVGGSIRGSRVSPELQTYLKENKEHLKTKIKGFYVICGNGQRPTGPQQVRQLIDNHLSEITGVTSVPSKAFNGRITMDLLTPGDAKRMKDMGFSDYDMMKRADFLEFGKTILSSVK